MVLIIGNYPYTEIDFSNAINNFEENIRFNFALINKNNGNKFYKLVLCNHAFSNLRNTFDFTSSKKKLSINYLYDKYNHVYKKEHIDEFYNTFKPNNYKQIKYISGNKEIINKFLMTINCPYNYKAKQARTGFATIIDELIKGEKVYLTHFTIEEEQLRHSIGVHEEQIMNESTGCHLYSKECEIKIIRWLHQNNFLDATLCMIENNKKLTFNTYGDLKPSKFILNLFKNINYVVK